MQTYEKLIWEDDFDGSELDMAKWSYRTGNWQVDANGDPVVPGWGNRELQYYTGNGENVSFGGSCLSLIARRENSPEQFGQTYGYAVVREGDIEENERYVAEYRHPYDTGPHHRLKLPLLPELLSRAGQALRQPRLYPCFLRSHFSVTPPATLG